MRLDITKRLMNIQMRHICGVINVGLAWAVGIGPKSEPATGVSLFIQQTWHLSHYALAAVLLGAGLAVLFGKVKGWTYLVALTPMMFYCYETLLFTLSRDLNFAAVILYGGLWFILVVEGTKP